ncbi:MAG TPA: hypothetical protein VMZ28_08445 [Kofleriaceae bacterium]|nr:hypothetical protein [Kofleriaceae bacterium]
MTRALLAAFLFSVLAACGGDSGKYYLPTDNAARPFTPPEEEDLIADGEEAEEEEPEEEEPAEEETDKPAPPPAPAAPAAAPARPATPAKTPAPAKPKATP